MTGLPQFMLIWCHCLYRAPRGRWLSGAFWLQTFSESIWMKSKKSDLVWDIFFNLCIFDILSRHWCDKCVLKYLEFSSLILDWWCIGRRTVCPAFTVMLVNVACVLRKIKSGSFSLNCADILRVRTTVVVEKTSKSSLWLSVIALNVGKQEACFL